MTLDIPPTMDYLKMMIQDRTGVPPDILSLRVDGKVLPEGPGQLDLASGTTVHANINARGMGWKGALCDDAYDVMLAARRAEFEWENLPKRGGAQAPFGLFRERCPADGSFTYSVRWYDEGELKAAQRSFVDVSGMPRWIRGTYQGSTVRRVGVATRSIASRSDSTGTASRT